MVDLKCCLGKSHIAKNARELPCGSIYCFDCLRILLVANNEFKCCCQEIHNIGDLERVPEAIDFKNILAENADSLINEMSKELGDLLNNAKSLCLNRTSLMDNFFNFIKEDVEIRVESIKCHLDTMAEKFYEKLSLVKAETENHLNAMNTYFTDNLSKYEEFLVNVKNEQKCLDKIYTCQEHVNNIKEFEQDFYTNLRNVLFKPNESFNSINETLIGTIKTPILDINKLRTHLPKKINSNIKICALAELNETQLAAIDHRRSDLIILNKNFEIEKQLTDFGGVKLNQPKAMCVNPNTDDVFVCDTGNNRLIILDNGLTKIKKIFGEKGNTPGKFSRPCDLQFFNDRLYVLDSLNKRIQIFNEDLLFIREIRLYKTQLLDNQQPQAQQQAQVEPQLQQQPQVQQQPQEQLQPQAQQQPQGQQQLQLQLRQNNLLSCPVHLTLNNDLIAVNDGNDSIFIYNYQGQLITSVEMEHLQTFLFIGSYLMAHKIDGSFLCFDCDFNEDNLQLSQIFHRFVGGLQHFASCMKFIDGNLIIPLSTKKCVVSFVIDRFSV